MRGIKGTARPAPLRKDEKTWLGVDVQLADGTRGQVWALHPDKGCVWVADGTDAHRVHRDDLHAIQTAAA